MNAQDDDNEKKDIAITQFMELILLADKNEFLCLLKESIAQNLKLKGRGVVREQRKSEKERREMEIETDGKIEDGKSQ